MHVRRQRSEAAVAGIKNKMCDKMKAETMRPSLADCQPGSQVPADL